MYLQYIHTYIYIYTYTHITHNILTYDLDLIPPQNADFPRLQVQRVTDPAFAEDGGKGKGWNGAGGGFPMEKGMDKGGCKGATRPFG